MERINLRAAQVTHFDILQQIENRCYDRLDTIHRTIDQLQGEILELKRQLQYETEDLERSQREMKLIEAESDAILAAGSHFETVEFIRTKEGREYYVIQYETPREFSFGYVSNGVFHICPTEYDSQDEAYKAIEKRELSLYLNETVMF